MDQSRRVAIVVHGGAGVISKSNMVPAVEEAYRTALSEATEAGKRILLEGGSSMDAVEAACIYLEDSPLFNAGKGSCICLYTIGSVYTSDEKHELDAAIMNGKDLSAGSVCSVSRVRNPITLARRVIEKT